MSALVAAVLSAALTLPAPAATAVPADPAVAAREAYNAGRYAEAAAGFLAAVQASPRDAEHYRALARARVWAKDAAGAVVAYRYYLELSADATDREKIQAELDNALKQCNPAPPPGPPVAGARLMAQARERAAAGDAGAALDLAAQALAKGYFAPDLADTLQGLSAPLTAAFEAELARFFAPDARADATAVQRLVDAFGGVERLRPLTALEASAAGGARGLAALLGGRPEEAVTHLVPVAPSDPRLRVALALALLRLGRADEAASGLASLNSEDRTVSFLLGLARGSAGLDPVAPLRRALDL